MTPAPHAGTLVSPMLVALLIFVIDYLRRRRKKTNHTMFVIVDAFADMQEMRRAAQRRYPHLEL